MGDGYPKRKSHFAAEFFRVLALSGAAADLGVNAAWLVTHVVFTEDAIRYTRAVRFFNEQLVARCGFANVKTLERARARAVELGWLHYVPGSRAKPGVYWVKVPADVERIQRAVEEPERQERLAEPAAEVAAPKVAAVPVPMPSPETEPEPETIPQVEPPKPLDDKDRAREAVARWAIRPPHWSDDCENWLVKWQAARKARQGSYSTEHEWEAVIAKWGHWSTEQWERQLIQSTEGGTKLLAIFDRSSEVKQQRGTRTVEAM